ncbi:nonsense-mediated mRNA decay factor SMG7-like [Montipora foliosa]|uniref:nonsense-mediated mRNA decay factor SMG7-like n=1 Tax=Montipora foliosa TaxID=591990 RepID=UPI0035F218DE
MAPILGSVPQVLRQAETLKAALKSSFDDFTVGSEGWQSRQRLQDLYKSILLTDLESALDKKVEQDLWNCAFKSQIDFLRQQAKERKGTKKVEVQAVLTLFLEASSGFYIQLLQELCLTYRLDIPGHVRSSQLGILEEINGNNCVTKKPHTQSCYYICQDCLVHLGDIARYCDDPDQAEVFYHHALVLVPSNGQPYNQLAILASGKGDELGTVYYYCRSIAVKNPFPAASTNLQKTLSKVVSRHNTRDVTQNISKAELGHIFLQFHGHVYLVQDLEEAKVLKDCILVALKGILKQNKFTSNFLIKLVSITLFVLWNVKTGGADELEEFDCIGKDEEECLKLTLSFAVELFDVLVLSACESGPSNEQSDVLPALNLLCQWFAAASPNTWNGDILKKAKIWEDFAALLNLLQVTYPHLPEKTDLPLYEDWELQCFLPLRITQRKLTYSMKRTKPDDEVAHRVGRLVRFANRLVTSTPCILSKVEDLATGLSQFSLKVNTSSPIEEISAQEDKFPKSPQDIDLESAGQKLLASLPTLNKATPVGTPFAETSSLFKGPLDVGQSAASYVAPSPSTVAQYSLFQSGWNVPLTSAALAHQDQSSGRAVVKPPNHHRATVVDPLAGSGGSTVYPPTLPSPQATENRRPTSFGTSFPSAGMQTNYASPSQSPFGGFGFGGGWVGSGVWAPNGASGGGGSSPSGAHNLQSIWGSDFTPSEGMSPLQQLLQEQKKQQKEDT